MKAHLLKVPEMLDHSFSYRQFKQRNVNNRWHFHPEIELIHIHQGSGTQFMGDHIKRFQGGESFCRYFKAKTGKKFTQFILELKVGYACKLLIEKKLDNNQISIESSFNNFTSFHKHFKAITGMTPVAYQKAYR